MAQKRARFYVGRKNSFAEVFRAVDRPTQHPEYELVFGPYRTRAGAEYVARHDPSANLTVSQAEKAAKRHVGTQSQ